LCDFANLHELHGGKTIPQRKLFASPGSRRHATTSALDRKPESGRSDVTIRRRCSSITLTLVSPSPQTGQQLSASRLVALTGFMGAGKTKVGRVLAGLLGWSFVDLDEEIELSQKMPIRDIFRLQGELQFREIETETLRQIVAETSAPTVIALGGGTFIQASNADLLRGSGASVVFLDTPIEEMLQRCQVAPQASAEDLRPLAADPDAFRALYMERLPQYHNADLAVNTAGRTAEENAREIATRLHLGVDPP
jgi:shikimate kinase